MVVRRVQAVQAGNDDDAVGEFAPAFENRAVRGGQDDDTVLMRLQAWVGEDGLPGEDDRQAAVASDDVGAPVLPDAYGVGLSGLAVHVCTAGSSSSACDRQRHVAIVVGGVPGAGQAEDGIGLLFGEESCRDGEAVGDGVKRLPLGLGNLGTQCCQEECTAIQAVESQRISPGRHAVQRWCTFATESRVQVALIVACPAGDLGLTKAGRLNGCCE